jgi:hypothetical protein
MALVKKQYVIVRFAAVAGLDKVGPDNPVEVAEDWLPGPDPIFDAIERAAQRFALEYPRMEAFTVLWHDLAEVWERVPDQEEAK